MTLEDAADDLVAKLDALDDDIGQAKAALAAVLERVAAAREQMKTEWAALEEAAEDLLQALEDEPDTLTGEGGQTEKALRDVATALGEEEEELTFRVSAAEQGLQALGEHVTDLEPGLVKALEGVQTAGGTLVKEANTAEKHWEETLRQHLTQQKETTRSLHDLGSRVADEVEKGCEEIRDQAHTLTGAQEHWEGALKELEETVVESLLESLRTAYAAEATGSLMAGVEGAKEIVGHMVERLGRFEKQLDEDDEWLRQALARLHEQAELAADEAADELAATMRDVHDNLGQYETQLTSLGFLG